MTEPRNPLNPNSPTVATVTPNPAGVEPSVPQEALTTDLTCESPGGESVPLSSGTGPSTSSCLRTL